MVIFAKYNQTNANFQLNEYKLGYIHCDD